MGIERFVTNSVKSCLNTAVFVLPEDWVAGNYQAYRVVDLIRNWVLLIQVSANGHVVTTF
ncbi:hypothetical protein TUM12147_29350 [Citrobacter europaeus]|nr:hypothetical protein TUM12147_29350 [Citrobacter europaeus]GIZ21579.1 hypothetical protein TUM12148_02430 [Citrobacter europaeus]